MHINPFELLGVTAESGEREIRKAFYRLSLICHPDHGGNAHDMIELQKAYEHAIGLRPMDARRELRLPTIQEIQEEIANVSKESVAQILSLRNDISREHFTFLCDHTHQLYTRHVTEHLLKEQDLQSLEEFIGSLDFTFSQNNYAASESNGYGEYMAVDTGDDNDPVKQFEKTMIVYKEPHSWHDLQQNVVHINKKEPTIDFSLNNMTDYKMAHTSTTEFDMDEKVHEEKLDEDTLSSLLNRITLQRKELVVPRTAISLLHKDKKPL